MPTIDDYEPGTPSWVDLASPDLPARVSFYTDAVRVGGRRPGPDAGHYHMFIRTVGRWPVAARS